MNAITQSILSGGRAATLQELVPLFKEIRISRGINQRALDQSAKLADGYVGKLEVGTRGVGVDSVNALLSALGLELALVERVVHKQGSACKVLATPRELACPAQIAKINRVRRSRKGAFALASSMTARQRLARSRKAAKAAGEVHKRKAALRRAVKNRENRAIEAAQEATPIS